MNVCTVYPNSAKFTQHHKLFTNYSYVKYPLKVKGIYGGNVSGKSIFRSLYVYPY